MTDLSLPRTDRAVHEGEPGRPYSATVPPAARRLWIADRPSIDVPCSIEIERSGDTLHAHVSLQGIEVDCGDEVLIHAAPTTIEFGGKLTTMSRATVIKAGPFRRWRTRMQSYFALTELYEVGFQPRHEIQFTSAGLSPAQTAERIAQ
ncbi:MAG: hypothetical protein SH859_08490 [Hyphomicrobium aestuarii]|nr:hypothetical protein [Hyphomicrobium aestuarii]